MHRRTKMLFACLGAAAMLAAVVGSASANRLSLSNRETRIVWRPLRLIALGESVVCNVTLEAEFHSNTIHKINNALIGNVTGATVNECTEGSATVLRETLPWHITYRGISGSLPNFRLLEINLINASFRADPPGLPACLARTTTTRPGVGNVEVESNGLITRLDANREFEIPLSGGIGCGLFSGRFEGSGSVTNLTGSSNVSVRLI